MLLVYGQETAKKHNKWGGALCSISTGFSYLNFYLTNDREWNKPHHIRGIILNTGSCLKKEVIKH